MSLSYAERIKTAAGLPDAMLILAEGIDALLAARAVDSTPDPWSHWTRADPNGVIGENPGIALAPRAVLNEAAITAVQAQLAEATDPDDIRALEARLWLLKDEGRPVDIEPETGARATATEDLVTLPGVSDERKLTRWTWAREHKLGEFLGMDDLECLDAYAAGGPEWLYANRDAVMQMPVDWRRDLIADLELDSPAAAAEMARDILKTDTDPDFGRPGA